MITVKCAKCKFKIFKYIKIGQGRILKIYNDRITEDNSTRENGEVLCKCGNVVGKEFDGYIKPIKGSFTHTGRKQG